MYIFCPDKMGSTYATIFAAINDKLSELGLQLSADYFMADFEVALRSATQNAFPSIQIKGCHFHYAKSVWKFVQNNGHKSTFSTDSNFATFIKIAIGMAFVPLGRLQDGLDLLYEIGISLP